MSSRVVAVLAALVSFAAFAVADADDCRSVQAIAASRDALDAALKGNRGTKYSGNIDDPSSWHIAGRDEDGAYAWASVYRLGGRIRKVEMELSSESGDWVLLATYYFRTSGLIAHREERLNTFYGAVTRIRSFDFDCAGKCINTKVLYRDLKSKKPLASPPEEFIGEDAPNYGAVIALPFNRLNAR